MQKKLLAGVFLILLFGCASNAEIAQRTCRNAGLQIGTNEYASCYVSVINREQQKGMALMGMGTSMMGSGSASSAPAIRNYNIGGRNYTCTTQGNYTSCN